MTDQKTSTLVFGEAPESDEEDVSIQAPQPRVDESSKLESSTTGVAVDGEALESDEEIELHTTYTVLSASSTTELAVKVEKANVSTVKMQTAALKKLREKNRLLYEGLTSFKRQILTSTNFELNNINQQLLRSQIELQQTLNNTRQVKTNLSEYHRRLKDILMSDYIPRMNVKVPTNII